MDFFAAQERTRRTTRFLLLFFLLAFLAVALATALACGFALGWYTDQFAENPGSGLASFAANDVRLLLTVTALTLGLMILASLYRAATLSRGGAQVARMLGASAIAGDDTDALHRRLINVVEEMSIASGLPVPEIFVLDKESGINAFAAGLTPSDAAVAVTRGALEQLDRAELQGVIAHEFSHILNGDMRLNQKLIGFSYGILVLSIMGRWLLRTARYGRRGRNNGGVAAALGIGASLLIIGGVGVLLSRVIKAAVSRQRESLADASAVQFTREPSALAGALKKIGGYTAKLSSVDDEEVAHMLFEGRAGALSRLLATHPPLAERIKALDPRFKAGDYIAPRDVSSRGAEAQADSVSQLTSPLATPAAAGSVVGRTGNIETAEVGQILRGALPDELYHAAHNRQSSMLLILALALSSDSASCARQKQLLLGQLGAQRAALTTRLHEQLKQLDRRLQLPLLELAMPTIKQRPPEQLRYLFELIEQLQASNEEHSLFDFVLLRLLAAYLRQLPEQPLNEPVPDKLSSSQALSILLGSVAAFGQNDAATARAAFLAGAAEFAKFDGPQPDFNDLAAARQLTQLDAALTRLARIAPRAKRQVLQSVIATIRHDKVVAPAEMELYRAISATLGCPSPPTLETSSMDETRQART
jgi:Zn-dependent protease with chaperone function